MKSNTRKFVFSLFLVFALLFAGCAGRDFVKPEPGKMLLGVTSKADVIQQMGEPGQKGEILLNDHKLDQITYVYAAVGGEPAYPDVVPARAMIFYFYKDVLVGESFVSSFKSDSSDFDSDKIAGIKKGETTGDEVIALLGNPSGRAIYPVIKTENEKAMVYSYTQVTGGVFNMKAYNKELKITVDDSNIVTDVEYASSESN